MQNKTWSGLTKKQKLDSKTKTNKQKIESYKETINK